MLEVIRRNAGTWLVKTLFVILVLSFAIWGVGDYANQQLSKPLMEVDGTPVSAQQVKDARDRDLRRLRQAFGGNIDDAMAEKLQLKEQALRRIMSRIVLFNAARDMDLTVAPDRLRAQIQREEAFLRDGVFDLALYTKILRREGLTPKQFEGQLRENILVSQLEGSIRSAAFAPDWMVEERFRSENEKRAVALLSLDPATLEADIPVDDALLGTYLTDHQSEFMTEVRVKLHYAVMDANSVMDEVKVEEAEIKARYDEEIKRFSKPETRHVRHILARAGDGAEEQAKALEVMAKAKAELAAGKPFAEVAKALSDDISASEGGDLGTFGKGTMPPSFEEAAFSLALNVVSDAVKTPFGYHLIEVVKINADQTTPFAEARDELHKAIVAERAQELVYKKVDVFEDQIYTSGGDLASVAKNLNLRFKETGFMTRSDPLREGVEKEPKFINFAFATPKGETSAVSELEDGSFFALKVVEREEPRAQTLDEVREGVTAAYRRQEAHKLARTRMEEVLKKLTEGAVWNEVAQGLVAEQPEPFTLDKGDAKVSPQVRQAAFRLSSEKRLLPNLLEDGEGLVILRLVNVIPADMEALAQSKEDLRKTLAQELGNELFGTYLQGLLKEAEVTVDREALSKL